MRFADQGLSQSDSLQHAPRKFFDAAFLRIYIQFHQGKHTLDFRFPFGGRMAGQTVVVFEELFNGHPAVIAGPFRQKAQHGLNLYVLR